MTSPNIASWTINGLVTAPVTPFNENGNVNFDLFDSYAGQIKDHGIKNLFVNGTTGEALSMTVDERKSVAEKWMEVGKSRFEKIIVHVGTGNYMESMQLAKHAESIGADGIACVAPSYLIPLRMEDYVNYIAKVASAAPNTAFFLYDINFLTGINLSVTEFFKKAKSQIPTLKGLKHTSPQLDSIHRVLTDHPDMIMMMGTNDLFLEGLVLGCKTTICDSFLGHVLSNTKEAFDKGDVGRARACQKRALDLMTVRRQMELTVPGGSKAILRCLGLAVGQPRLPVAPMTESEENLLKEFLKEIGFFEWYMEKLQ
ncbi:DgyrCDS2030 [Dimorphilus gyrociliatus]|uniref:N-acetylneuraminate lyase n=1 Tax=Dimorphilus gyrociliatus TaxID=2664684 RepID=A0A7I8VC60_9ANNE|nr:DgyrCDS2030 [Dimorphilus gyrociliatus]